VTTQHTHHEHNDVDQSVVEYPSASETTTVDSTTSNNSPSPGTQGEAALLVAEQTSILVDSKTEQDTKTASAFQQATIQIQEPSQNQSTSEGVSQEDSSPDGQATVEASLLNKTVAYGDEIFQTEVKPAVALHETQVQDKAQTTTHEEKDGEVEQNRNEDGDGSKEKLTRTETQSFEISLQTEETPTRVEKTSLPTASASVDIAITVQQSELKPSQPEVLPEGIVVVGEAGKTSVQSEYTKETSSLFPYAEVAPLINTKAEEVRPFTKFIEEFRLAEATRLQSALRESQVEAFALLNSVETLSSEDKSTEKLVTSENGEVTETTEGTYMHAQAKEPVSTESKDASATEQKTPTNPANRPVSPLLRPATRLRVPRHGLVRHQREEQQNDEVTLPTVPNASTEIKETDATMFPVPTSEPVSPKPGRRYRFDRPSSHTTHAKNIVTVSTSPTTSTFPNSNESVPPTVPATAVKAGSVQDKDTRETPTSRMTQREPSAPAQEQVAGMPETNVLTEPTTPTQTPEQGRRRPVHKEPAASTPHPVVETPMPVAETGTKTEEITPEDLPPLEYSELQKASNSRRRRRHRSGSSGITSPMVNIANDPVVPGTPASSSSATPLPSQMPSMPQISPSSPIQTPAYQNPTTNGVYNIVSGYTLNQMNQGNEVVGPFMGPEPSPARGSVLSRDSRATRTETQRGSVTPSSFVSRSAEHGLHGPSAASMAQFASVVTQAIQTQTDRMVTELRRANQAPANVSVNLPPFPSTERVGVFVDVANLLYSARTLRIAVDFGKLLDFLRGNRRLVRAHAYCPTSPQPGDEQMFLQAVKGLGYRITTKNYKTFSSGAKKADLDLDLCMDVVRLIDGRAVDCIVLVSGDSDFMPMLDYCSDHGVRVEVAAFDGAMSATLRQSCDLFVNLSMLEEIRA
jgi:uncharacterized LabA/DUF88 family protein